MAERQIVVCDRCNSHSLEFPNYDAKEWGKMTVLSGNPALSQLRRTTDGVADLCPTCVASVKRWWKQAKIVEDYEK